MFENILNRSKNLPIMQDH